MGNIHNHFLIAFDSNNVSYGDAVRAFFRINNGRGKSGFAFYMAEDIQLYGETTVFAGSREECEDASERLTQVGISFKITEM